jgi:hypothetical protein
VEVGDDLKSNFYSAQTYFCTADTVVQGSQISSSLPVAETSESDYIPR